jgi:putative ABC transport system substrate-binding protein
MKRRDVLGLLASSLIGNPVAAEAQQVTPSRIGFLRVGPPPPTYIGGFREGLQEQGLIEGRDIVIEFALAQSAKQIPETALQLARTQPGIIVAAGTPSVFPARDAAGAIPVVFVATFDPVATGLVSSLARPGGKVTGLTTISGDLVAKRLELLKEFFPTFRKVAILIVSPVQLRLSMYSSRGSQRRSSVLNCRSLLSASRLILRSYSSPRVPQRRWC